ncbi:UDP-2,3-diacylglucosamine diphosphatase [Rhodohalobacter mucosus]|uniref:UDP-2,3-diacylglucosamine hydrolase n=1 Tax=Rhodohalobacter mucosus TaxID=2079485 RepID=A0A316TMR9_9BACT|nr:UDP-2,3-diacylglucosamine diphosphatase [Rhodohalobacter mucosus]PWN05078.1 UDP-2,3-diacylglucosamine hydrolase [Rhodohalobacter mucosus]
MNKRPLDIAVISDVHLGTVGCHALELLQYLNSIDPKMIILNGDFVDIWNFRKYYWPESHMMVLRTLLTMMTNGTDIYYLTGNHDEVLRKVSSLQLGPFFIRDKLILELKGEKVWIFHGDIFDITMKQSKWIAKAGSHGYDLLILLNRFINKISEQMGRGKLSLSKKIKDSVKKAVRFIDDFETTAIDLAIDQGYDYVICGHIHQPKIRGYENENGSVIYMNSGDWIENLTALEYDGDEWNLYKYNEEEFLGQQRIEKWLERKRDSRSKEVIIG